MYQAVTHKVRVTVVPRYLDERSDPSEGKYFWAYTVEITNLSDDMVQLRSRYWRITDAHGRLQEVRGPGVVGEEPLIPPQQTFEYTSGCPLTTPSGFMVGSYEMETRDGRQFTVAIPAFSLDLPDAERTVN